MISTIEDYEYIKRHGFEPLTNPRFPMTLELRKQVQEMLFGKGHTAKENEKFYRWCWKHKAHICEETLKPLEHYSACFVSHILARGAHPAMAHDPRNVNILCLEAHNRWENGDKENMRIYEKNQITIKQLKKEYYETKNQEEKEL